MGPSVSVDIRRRMVRGVERGKSRRAVAAQFEVAPSTAVRLLQRLEETGSIAPAKQGRPAGSGKLGPHKAFLIDRVNAEPDITMPELAAALKAARGLEVHASCIAKLLRAEGFTYKKNAAGVRTRARRRQGGAP